MHKQIAVILILFILIIGALPAIAQNPFTSKGSPSRISHPPVLLHSFLIKIAVWQQQLNQKMAILTRQARETGSLRPLLSLIIIAFAYGVLHAAGPGHGKAVALSYIISRGRKIGSSILFGNLIAFFHGLSGAFLVLVLHFVLRKGFSGSLEVTTRTTQLISYSLIVVLGACMLVTSIYSWRRKTGNTEPDGPGRFHQRQKGPIGIAMAVGMVPCPGVVMVMLFSFSLNLVGLGLLLALFMTLGMAVTISMVVVAGLTGKNLAIGVLKRRQRLANIMGRLTEAGAALMVMTLGLVFLAAAI